MLIIKYLSKLLKLLQSGETPGRLAGGFILGMVMGLTPFWNIHNLIVFILIVIIRVNISMALLAFAVSSGIAYLLDPLFHNLGYWVLVNIESLKGLWTAMYNSPLIALTNFNNTVVMGSLIVSILLLAPVYFLVKWGVVVYREKINAKVQQWKIVQLFKSSKLYTFYEKINDWRQ
ncbi:MAG TPA: TIGR03546 family protein [bacterium]|nr:TIGR03546 family protein [bacterium]HPN46161.1 TIGR03546 family protein [bacterium]